MTARSRLAVLVSATTLAATLALAPVAYAQNAGDGMKKDTMG
jgi:pentapeptide MXKDX repeat protein